MNSSIKGSLIGLKINGFFVSCETSCDFSCDVEMLPVAPVEAGRWKEVIPGTRSWTMSVNGNLLLKTVGADVKKVLDAILSGDIMQLEFASKSADSLVIKGKAYPQTAGVSAPVSGKANWTVNFQGSGPFETDFQVFSTIINEMPINSLYPTIVKQQ